MTNLVDRRLVLHDILKDIMSEYSDGPKDNRVWFKPDSNVRLKYPCIVYTREGEHVRYANNLRYFLSDSFQITVMDRDSDSEIVNKILDKIQTASRQNELIVDGLYHFIITISNGVIINGSS